MGFSYQKARFVSDHKDPEKRSEWLEKTWTKVMNQAKPKDAHILFGDEASFPQWGTPTCTWAKRRQQPTVPTSGIRKRYKVFHLIDYFTGRFFCKDELGRMTSETYSEFLRTVLDKTKKHIILIQDGARHHTRKAMQKFFDEPKESITVHPLPSYSPDYSPIAKLCKEIKRDGTHLHYFPTFDDLVLKIDKISLTFSHRTQRILLLFGMYDELTNCVGGAA
jgi:transposase